MAGFFLLSNALPGVHLAPVQSQSEIKSEQSLLIGNRDFRTVAGDLRAHMPRDGDS
jgi:hypothetical protein